MSSESTVVPYLSEMFAEGKTLLTYVKSSLQEAFVPEFHTMKYSKHFWYIFYLRDDNEFHPIFSLL